MEKREYEMLSQRRSRSRFDTALRDLRRKTRVDDDIKISKTEVLQFACSYIDYLESVLSKNSIKNEWMWCDNKKDLK